MKAESVDRAPPQSLNPLLAPVALVVENDDTLGAAMHDRDRESFAATSIREREVFS
jgi:hypothetical protein